MARKILLADDSVTAQNMGRKILADAGYEVITVNNGSAALKKIAETKPDLIVLDVYMPGYSGLEVCQRLKEAQETARIPVLLTVGKLEPFKPEEAKRVRAEGFIVKPFEASELLATLAKLEDKIVPRAEASKPGRFARANAAIDEGRFDKTVAPEEDTGWKNRIGFPSKKKKPAEDEQGDDSSFYNPVNKDLRTVVDRKQASSSREDQTHQAQEEARVDLGALAPEGLPNNVTPEEIAALAAAAAQVKGKIAESTFAESVPEQPVAAPIEAKVPEVQAEVQATEVKATVIEEKPEAKAEAQPAAELPKEITAPPATFAEQQLSEQKLEEKIVAAAEEPKSSAAQESVNVPSPSPADVMAALAGLEPEAGKSFHAPSGSGSGSHSADEPVTMAVATGAQFAGSASRWTAVPVALAADELSISLEQEMQKTFAAFAAAEVAQAKSVTAISEIPPVAAEPVAAIETVSPVESVTPEMMGLVATTPQPEVAKTEPAKTEPVQAEAPVPSISPVSVTTDAVTAAVKEFERVAAAYSMSHPPAPVEPAPVHSAEPVAPPAPEPTSVVTAEIETKVEAPPVVEASVSEPEPVRPEPAALEAPKHDAPGPVQEPKYEELRREEPKEEQKQRDVQKEEPALDAPTPIVAAVSAPEVAQETPATSVQQSEIAAPPSANEAPVNEVLAAQSSANLVSSDATEPAPPEPAATATKDTGKKESEIAETTAAAWASWRRIRESGDAKAAPAQPATPKQEAEEPAPVPQDQDKAKDNDNDKAQAAMAVAAGAERAPEEVPAAPEESGEIASIVDSVLADMRPRIFEEISKKMGKKK